MPHLALRLRFVLIVVVLTCHGVGQRAVRAQGSTEGVRAFEHAHATQAARNPVGLSLHIRTESGSTDFGIGEPITLVLEFSDQDGARQDGAGEDGARYDFDSRTYDRSGRLEIDRIRVAPAERVEDPLHDYYHAMGLGFAGGGLSRVPAPLTSPRVLSLDVNEFIRFTRPGTYRVYVESHRFLDRQAPTPRSRPLPLVSNILELTIAAQRTDASPPSVLPARALRHADTAEAAVELARRLLASNGSSSRVGTDAFHLRFGLYETTHRSVALQAIRQGLATMTRAVNEHIPAVAAFLDVMVEYPRTGRVEDGDRRQPAEGSLTRMRAYQCRIVAYQRQALAAGLRGSPEDAARAAATFAVAELPAHCPASAPDVPQQVP